MFNLKSIGIVLMGATLFSCTDQTLNENNGPEEGTNRTSSVAFATEGVGDLSVFVFNKNNENFLYRTLYSEGWIERDGKKILFKDMDQGDYKFFFLANKCTNLSLPEFEFTTRAGEGLNFENMIISHKVMSTKENCFAPADELYMQDNAELANFAYTINGNRTIEAHLTRAVGKVEVQLGRGYKSGTDADGKDIFVPVPYTNGKSIAELFKGYEIEVTDCGDHLAINGCAGKANVYVDFVAGQEGIRTVEAGDEDNPDGQLTGFALLDGPFILPPATTSTMKVRVKLIPADGVNMPVFERELQHGVDGDLNIARNHKLSITFWLDTVSPEITATVNIADMSRERTGDSGMWY